MSIPLVWKAIELSSTIFNPILYPHIITANPKTEQISIVTRFRKRKRFHLSTCVLTTILLFELHFLARHIFESSFEYKHLTPFYIELTALTLLHLVLTFINQTAGQQLWTSVNAALKLERSITRQTMAPVGYACQISHFELIREEIGKCIRKDPSSDNLGIILYGMSLTLSFVGVVWAPFGVYYNFDPGYFFFDHFFHPMSNQPLIIKVCCYATRLLMAYWTILEACRSYILTLIFYAVYWNIIMKCLRSIFHSPGFSRNYTKLHIVLQIGQKSFGYMVVALLVFGFVITVVGNYVSLMGWKFIRFEVNISICWITVVVYLVISTCLPTVIKLHEESKLMLNMLPAMYSQKCYILAKGQPLSTKELHKLWQKTCKVQKPITIYWGTSKFKKGFNSKYYYSIMDYTVNLMLGYEATHDN